MSRSLALAAATGITCLTVAAVSSAAEIAVGSGASIELGGAALDLGCSDLTVSGTFDAASGGFQQARNMNLVSSGTLEGGTGTLEVAGNWDNGNGGTFNADGSSVAFVDGCGVATATISGSSTFATLSAMTSTGKTYQFEAGSTQQILTELVLSGAAGNLLVLRSTSPGNEATFDVAAAAASDFVDIQDIHASPAPFVLGPNSLVGSNSAAVRLCGDIDGSLAIDAGDVAEARDHLMGLEIPGSITLCNVFGPFDPGQTGADCDVADIFLLERVVAGVSVTLENGCKP